jgi:predicted transcriptional regulator
MNTLPPKGGDGKSAPSSDRSASAEKHRGINYAFDPIPKTAVDLVVSKNLKPIDSQILAILLRYRSRMRDSCWTTIPRLAKGVGRSDSTVQRSLRRLKEIGLIRHMAVEVPDPDEPRNKTGWRFYFAFMDGNDASRAHAHARCLGVNSDTPPVADLTPPRSQECDPPGVIFATQVKAQGNPLPPGARENQDDDDKEASSSSFSSAVPEEMQSEEEMHAWAAAEEMLPDFRAFFPDLQEGQVRDVVKVHGSGRVAEILEEIETRAKRKPSAKPQSWGYVLNALKRMEVEQGPYKPREPRPATPVQPAAPATQETPEDRQRKAAFLIGQARSRGIDFRWVEDKAHFVPITTRQGAHIGLYEANRRPYAAEIRAILDQERLTPGWVNPAELVREPARAFIDDARRRFWCVELDAEGEPQLVRYPLPKAVVGTQEGKNYDLMAQGAKSSLLARLEGLRPALKELLSAEKGVTS